MVEYELPKLRMRVRFPLSALLKESIDLVSKSILSFYLFVTYKGDGRSIARDICRVYLFSYDFSYC